MSIPRALFALGLLALAAPISGCGGDPSTIPDASTGTSALSIGATASSGAGSTSSSGGATSSSSSASSGSSSASSSGSSSASSGGTTGTTTTGTTTTTTSTGSTTGTTGTPCATRITYGNTWIHGASHPASYDDASGNVTWDGVCTPSGADSYAVLSNGWKPYFSGHSGCVIALDTTCPGSTSCKTRVGYGPTWSPGPSHPNFYDDVSGRVFWDSGACTDHGSTSSSATLSNGWTPYFTGAGACEVSFRYTQCGGLYANAILPSCANPGVLVDGNRYVLACTSGDSAAAFTLRTSPDLVTWTSAGHIFASGHRPSWAVSDFWAPEIHKVGTHYVAYFSARGSDGKLAIGAATASAATGPFTDLGHPLIHDASMGMIDVSEFTAANGSPYLIWKADGNAVGQHTPIYGQALNAAGTALTGTRKTLITNDRAWEGGVVEGPWILLHGGTYYLFYSGNSYANSTYAVGVAKASAPLGPYTKLASPILQSDVAWRGPGHCSVVDTPEGNTVMVYHAWQAGHVNGSGDSRHLLIDNLVWSGGWPQMPEAPSVGSRPMP